MSELVEHSEELSKVAESGAESPTPAEKAAASSRRTFLFKVAVALNAAVGAVMAVPIVGYLLGPVKKSSDVGDWVALGPLDNFPVGETRLADFVSPVSRIGDGQTAKTACWVRRIAQDQFQVFAINCAHLNCPVRWFPESHLFMCPCHGGAYYEDGSRASGPPERGLFEYRYQIAGDTLSIHAGDMPTLSTQASCGGAEPEKKLVQIQAADTRSDG